MLVRASTYELDRYYEYMFAKAWRGALCRIATCNGRFDLECREISPRWVDKHGADIMNRSTIFWDDNDVIDYCKKHKPHGLQFGGVLPNDINTYGLLEHGDIRKRQRKVYIKEGLVCANGELVIDVDMDDYDRTGICSCARTRVCNTCWAVFMDCGRKVIDYWLRDVYCFHSILYVFSGRRGFHAYVYDERVLDWSRDQRTAFVTRITNPLEHTAHIYDNIITPHLKFVLPHGDDVRAPWAFYPIIDLEVTKDASHAKGMPLTLHHSTMYLRIPMPPDVYGELQFIPERDSIKPNNCTPELFAVFIRAISHVLDKGLPADGPGSDPIRFTPYGGGSAAGKRRKRD